MRFAAALSLALLSTSLAVAPARAQMLSPEGSGCEDVIARWQDFSAKENQGGHMDQSVFDKIQTEIAQATAACGAGQDAQAVRMIEASKRRHGY